MFRILLLAMAVVMAAPSDRAFAMTGNLIDTDPFNDAVDGGAIRLRAGGLLINTVFFTEPDVGLDFKFRFEVTHPDPPGSLDQEYFFFVILHSQFNSFRRGIADERFVLAPGETREFGLDFTADALHGLPPTLLFGLQAVPLPATGLMLLAGLGALGFAARRRRVRAAA